ncbi:Homeobox-like domain superfamily [Arabidopsis suecica]|uniref:Homeobox-like domain superfamily n=1 Tax=Arabidopsis suecica TaxID=45249 RepID=A0A8T1ZZA4_ARASU|nr:Homeobox-like domain superfamily [Arabidopsis suecica]
MSRRKSTVDLPQPIRRSARLISMQNRDSEVKPRKDLVFGSEPPKKTRREVLRGLSKRLVYSLDSPIAKKSPGLNISKDGFPSLRRSLRLSSRECCGVNKEKPFTKKTASTSSSRTKSSNFSSSCALRRSPRFSSGGGGSVDQSSFSIGRKSGNSVLSRCSTKSISSERGKGGDGVKSKDRSRSRLRPKTKQLFSGCDDNEEEEEEVSVCLSERKRMRIAKPNEEESVVPKADEVKRKGKEEDEEDEDEEEGLKTKKKLEKGGWTEDLELALQGAYLTVKPSPNFWKKVAKMVPGKSAQECFDRVNSALITPRQAQPRRARNTNLSTIPQFSLSASKLLKPNSPKTKIRQRKNNLSKKVVRHLLEKQNHMDQGLGFDLFSVLEPNITSNFLSTPMEKGQSLPKILESPVPCSSKDPTTLVSPPVLKQVKNKALHEKYIDHLHIREAKRKAESTRLAGKENIRPIEIQKKDSVRAAKDALFFDVQDAIQKLKGLEAETSSSSSEFCYGHGETDEEDEI